MSLVPSTGAPHEPEDHRDDVAALLPMLRRVVRPRVIDEAAVDDIVQETLVRVLAAAGRVQPGMLEPYAIVTARNLVASAWNERDRHRRNQHRVVDLQSPEVPGDGLLAREEHHAVAQALTRLSERERETLLAHEVSGQDTRSLANELGSTVGAVAAQLNRTRARMRVDYLLALQRTEAPTDRCRPVLLAISSGNRRRQQELDAGRHLLECAGARRGSLWAASARQNPAKSMASEQATKPGSKLRMIRLTTSYDGGGNPC